MPTLATLSESLSGLWPILLAAFGIGLVIFVHEAGHFVAARLCGVRVDVFSLGFGPRVLAWRRGPTVYQIAALPLGGYVKMAGEESAEAGARPAPDELPSKSVGQRFLIYSGGVLANVLFAMIVFPVLLSIGVPFEAPVLGEPVPGSPAWQAGVEPGTRVLEVNGNDVFGFIHVTNEIALGSPNETVMRVVAPGESEPRTVRLTPVYNEAQGIYWIGQRPAYDAEGRIAVERGSPAARAGLASGDRVLEVVGAPAGIGLEDQLVMPMLAGHEVEVRVARDGAERTVRVAPERSPDGEQQILGVAPVWTRVTALRGSAAASRFGLAVGDRLLEVDGAPLLRGYDLLRALTARPGEPRRARVARDGEVRELEWPALSLEEAVAFEADVALAPDEEAARVVVTAGSAAEEAGLRDGDRIVAIDGQPVVRYASVLEAAQAARDGRTLALTVEGADGENRREISVATRAYRPWSYGFGLEPARYVYRAKSPVEAVRVGVASSWKLIEDSWLTLKRMALGQVSGKNVGGIITIGVVSHSWASEGLSKLFFFLCMLSMNLAFLNVLPIPVLDGGHLFFLLVEKVKGSPVSERVLGYSQMVGIVLILSLMVYVTFNDIRRLFG